MKYHKPVTFTSTAIMISYLKVKSFRNMQLTFWYQSALCRV